MKKLIAFLIALTAVIALGPGTAAAKKGDLTGLYNKRYCEIFAVHMPNPPEFSIDIYNTVGLNNCPPAQWNALDWDQIKAETGALGTKPNGPRRWLIDAVLGGEADQPVVLSGLEVRKVAVLNIATLTPENYTEMKIDRTTTWVYNKGRKLHYLVSPTGRKYALQAYTTNVDRSLRAKNLHKLAGNPGMGMPTGWKFKTIRLKKQLRLPAPGVATILRDGLEGTYQKFKFPKNFFKPVKKPVKKTGKTRR
mgnify:CR=1 FL=1